MRPRCLDRLPLIPSTLFPSLPSSLPCPPADTITAIYLWLVFTGQGSLVKKYGGHVLAQVHAVTPCIEDLKRPTSLHALAVMTLSKGAPWC